LIEIPTSHTTVRTVRYTAVQNSINMYQVVSGLARDSRPFFLRIAFVTVVVMIQLLAIRMQPYWYLEDF